MSIYGEGLYETVDGRLIEDVTRQPKGGWNPRDDEGRQLSPLPTPEWKRPVLFSVYAITKYAQERLCMTVAPAYGMESVALRLFNVFGAGQALSNPLYRRAGDICGADPERSEPDDLRGRAATA